MSVWSTMILEGYCGYSYMHEKKSKYYNVKDNDIKNLFIKSNRTLHVEKNKFYVSPSNRPKWCIKENKRFVPKYRCLYENCKFFGHAEGEIKLLYKEFNKYKKDKKKNK